MISPFPRSPPFVLLCCLPAVSLLSPRCLSPTLLSFSLFDDAPCFIFSLIQWCSLTLCVSRSGRVLALCRSMSLHVSRSLLASDVWEPRGEPSIVDLIQWPDGRI